MNNPDRILRDHRIYDVSDDLASFVSESPVGSAPDSDDANQALLQFPEEGTLPAAVTTTPRARRLPMTALLAAIFLAAIGGLWWRTGASIFLSSRSPDYRTTASRPEVRPPTETQAPINTPQNLPSDEVVIAAEQPPEKVEASSSPKPVIVSSGVADQPDASGPPRTTLLGTSGAPTMERAPVTSAFATESTLTAPAVPTSTPTRAAGFEAEVATAEAPPVIVSPQPRMAESVITLEPEALATIVDRSEQTAIQQTLGHYRNAYERLDAEAARSVWPSVNVRALARAFDSLTSQQLAFGNCRYDIEGAQATAHCTGTATYTPKVGNRGPRPESRQWTFHLRKQADGWKIESAQTSR